MNLDIFSTKHIAVMHKAKQLIFFQAKPDCKFPPGQGPILNKLTNGFSGEISEHTKWNKWFTL